MPPGKDSKIFSQEFNDRFGLGMAYLNMGRIASSKGDEPEKEKYFGKLKEMMHEVPGSFQVGMFFLGMGLDERMRGNYASAKKIFEDGLDIFKRIHNKNFTMVMRSELGHIERYTGHLSLARSIYQETILGWQYLGNRSAIAHQLECFGFLAISEMNPQCALKLSGFWQKLCVRNRVTDYDEELVKYDQAVGGLHSIFTEEEFNMQWAEGRAMTMDQAI